MFFFRKSTHREIDQNIENKEVLIQSGKKQLNKRVNEDLRTIHKINKMLGNGITLKIHHATGARHG